MTESETLYSKIQKRLIYISFLLAILIDFIPLSGSLFHWLPEFTALMLMYWIINRPQNVDIGTAFILGLLMDIGTKRFAGRARACLRYRRIYRYPKPPSDCVVPLRRAGGGDFCRLAVQRNDFDGSALAVHASFLWLDSLSLARCRRFAVAVVE